MNSRLDRLVRRRLQTKVLLRAAGRVEQPLRQGVSGHTAAPPIDGEAGNHIDLVADDAFEHKGYDEGLSFCEGTNGQEVEVCSVA